MQKLPKLKVEHSAKTTFRLCPVSVCARGIANDMVCGSKYYEENVVTSSKSKLLLMSFCLHIINYNS